MRELSSPTAATTSAADAPPQRSDASDFVRLRTGDVHWRVRRDAREALFGPHGLRLADWLKSGEATVVKHGPHRSVYRVRLDGRSYYLKHFRVPDTRAMFSQWLQGSKGRREWRLLQQAAAQRVPTIAPVALGEQRRGHFVLENYLVTEGIEDVEPLLDFVRRVLPTLPTDRQPRVRRRLCVGLAELTARMHEAGIQHSDLHAGNVLVRLGRDDRVELFLIDLQAARVRRRMRWWRSRAEIMALGANFLGVASASELLRFLSRYLELRPRLGLSHHAIARTLHAELWRAARRIWWRRDARCLFNNRRFFYRDVGTTHGLAVSEISETTFLALLRDPDAPLAGPSPRILKESASSTVAAVELPVAGMVTRVIYKRGNCPKLLDPLRAMLYRSPSLRAWIAGHALLLRGVPTPRPLAMMQRTRAGLVRATYLVTEEIAGACTLRQFLLEAAPTLPPAELRQRIRWLAVRLGHIARRLHDCQISHRDMKAMNFLISPKHDDPGALELHLIDLDGVQIWRTLPRHRRLQNLARAAVSFSSYRPVQRTDCLRFLRSYMPGGLRDAAIWKPLWRQVARYVQRKLAQNRERGRVVG